MKSESETVGHSVLFDSAIPWTAAHQAPLNMEFSRQEYWSGLSLSPGDHADREIKPRSPARQADSSPSEPLEKQGWHLKHPSLTSYL